MSPDTPTYLIVDAHEDLAYNMLTFRRDYTRPVEETRQHEKGSPTITYNGDTLLGYAEYLAGRVAVVFGTLFAAPAHGKEMREESQVYKNYEQAHTLYRKQVDTYHRLVDDHPDYFRLIQVQQDLDETISAWQKLPPVELPAPPGEAQDDKEKQEEQEEATFSKNGKRRGDQADQEAEQRAPQGPPVGLCILMEGAEGVRQPEELEEWWHLGVRIIGLAWAGTRFCGGTRQPGPLTRAGLDLLAGMAEVGFALDLSHMDQEAALQSLDAYPGTIIASHANAEALIRGIDNNRHLPDRVIHGMLERNAVIGIVPNNHFLDYTWKRGEPREQITLQHIVTQIDYICQMAGNALHVGLGTDFDGGFGVQDVPAEIDTIADLQKLVPHLAEKGYTEKDIANVLGMNWVNLLERILPESL